MLSLPLFCTIFAAPGVVANFTAEAKVITVVFSWDPPSEPNGIITGYELTYRVNGSAPLTNRTDASTTMLSLELDLSTNVTDISVRAFTSVGGGPAATAGDVAIPSAPTPRESLILHSAVVHG